MVQKCETPHGGGVSREQVGACFRELSTTNQGNGQSQPTPAAARAQPSSMNKGGRSRSDLAFHIRQFVPAADGVELTHRNTLLKARDFAADLRGKTISRRAYDHACDAHEMAGEYVYAVVSLAKLELAANYCKRLVLAAMLAEQLESEGGIREPS